MSKDVSWLWRTAQGMGETPKTVEIWVRGPDESVMFMTYNREKFTDAWYKKALALAQKICDLLNENSVLTGKNSEYRIEET